MSGPVSSNSNEKSFRIRRDMVPKEKIRIARSAMTFACGNCGKLEEPESRYKECAGANTKCKTRYCSEACQKSHWPKHRESCKKFSFYYPDLAKSCQTLMSNNLLANLVMMLMILEFDLLDKPRPGVKSLNVEIIVEFEPAEPEDFLKTFNPKATIDNRKVEGMLQLVTVVEREGPPPENPLGSEELFERQLEEERKGKGLPIVFVNFWRAVDEDYQGVNTCYAITEDDLELARRKKESGIPGREGKTVPLSAESCLSLINGLIELDYKNLWLLRMNMQEDDKRVLKDAAKAKEPDWLGLLIQEKHLQRVLAIKNDVQARRK